MKNRLFRNLMFLAVFVSFQNCAKETSETDQFSQSMSAVCEPFGQPCLKYEISVWPTTTIGPGYNRVAMKGEPILDGGALSPTEWSNNCVGSGDVLADCKTGESVTARFRQASSGRTLTVTFHNPGRELDFHSSKTHF